MMSGGRWGRSVLIVTGLVWAMVGVLIGREIAALNSQPGLAIVGVWYLLLGTAGLVVVGVIVGKLVRFVTDDSSLSGRLRYGGPASLVVGVVVGIITADLTGAIYREPVVLEANGRTAAEMAVDGMPFVARDEGTARCRSHEDSLNVATVIAEDLGELGPGTLRAWIALPVAGGGGHVELTIDGADLDGPPQPFWNGPVEQVSIADDERSGVVRFDGLPLTEDAALWPERISGSITWRCLVWLPGEVAPPPG